LINEFNINHNPEKEFCFESKSINILCMILMSVVLISCTSTSTSWLISIEDYTFASTGDGDQLVTIDDPAVFKRGAAAHLVL
jgi:hypothetical protein